ncbi:hypothetical protein HPB47_006943 [Ixodes persulcatus]|uniref:Uncharacterized protein n=1 Tax=Ixodes persulcatus TaxID=34615 RepID=A0AC60P9U6_IXOPE|nr:hypothetical protein HPB47_006943 [Ixodes persulcatus]
MSVCLSAVRRRVLVLLLVISRINLVWAPGVDIDSFSRFGVSGVPEDTAESIRALLIPAIGSVSRFGPTPLGVVFRDQVLGVVEAQRAAATARAREVVRTWADSSESRNICSQRRDAVPGAVCGLTQSYLEDKARP